MIKKACEKILLFSITILFFVSFANASFNFYGYALNATGELNLSNVNASIIVYNMSNQFSLVTTYSNLSDSRGFFNVSGIDDYGGSMNYVYKATLKLDNDTHIYISKSLPEFPSLQFSSLGVAKFYLQDGAKVNISVINETGSMIPFQYQVKDQKLGYGVAEEFNEYVDTAIVYLPLERNYSIMAYPNRTMPRSYNLNNLTAYTKPANVLVQFNTTEGLIWVSGYVKYNGIGRFSRLNIVPYLMEPSDMMFPSYSKMPYNMANWRGSDLDGPLFNDTVNPTNGFFNITLPGVPNGINILLLFVAQNDTVSETYGMYKNITLFNK